MMACSTFSKQKPGVVYSYKEDRGYSAWALGRKSRLPCHLQSTWGLILGIYCFAEKLAVFIL